MKIREKPAQKTFKMGPVKKNKTRIIKKCKFKPIKTKTKVDIQKMTVDEFMSGGFEDIDGDSNSEFENNTEVQSKTKSQVKEAKIKKKKLSEVQATKKNGIKAKPKVNKVPKTPPLVSNEDNVPMDDEESGHSEPELVENSAKKHKKDLAGLQTVDPEFYNYLKEHDKDLLNFEDSSSDDDKDEELEACHKAPETLEVASDESDFEPEDGTVIKRSDRIITMAMVNTWQEKLKNTNSVKIFRDVVDAFHAAVLRVSADGDSDLFRFKIEGSSVFNAVIRMCVVDLHSGLRSFLRLKEGSNFPLSQCKGWVKLKGLLKSYFYDLARLAGVTSPNMLSVLLKHIHQMTPFLVHFTKIAHRVLKRVIDLWSKSEDLVRVLSFLCALRITSRSHTLLGPALKRMYLTYVRNTKFLSPSNITEKNFMKQSLAELFALNDTISYQIAFLYIRQLAVHLRNAIGRRKKENFQAVYNWQYVSSLQLWADVFGLVPAGSPLRSLVYPLIQIIIGTIKLIPSAQFYPLRFHCCEILINLSSKCNTYIPVLPFLMEVLSEFDFNKEHKKVSMKPMDMTCLLRCSKLQMKENGFKDSLIENVNRLMIEYLATECYRISFPDIIVPAVLQLKQFVKDSRVANYTKLIKALVDKIMENSKYIEEERKKLNFKLNDLKAVEAIETGIKVKGTPFLSYYNGWKKIYMQQQARKVVDNLKIGDYKLPVIYKFDKKKSREQARSSGPPELFPSDDEQSNFSFGSEDLRECTHGNRADDDSETDQGTTTRNKLTKKPGKPKKAEPKSKESRSTLKKANNAKKKPKSVVQEVEGMEDVVEDLELSDSE